MTTKSPLTIIWLLSYISIASVSAAMITPALPDIEQKFALSTGIVEWVASAFLIGYVIGHWWFISTSITAALLYHEHHRNWLHWACHFKCVNSHNQVS